MKDQVDVNMVDGDADAANAGPDRGDEGVNPNDDDVDAPPADGPGDQQIDRPQGAIGNEGLRFDPQVLIRIAVLKNGGKNLWRVSRNIKHCP